MGSPEADNIYREKGMYSNNMYVVYNGWKESFLYIRDVYVVQ